MSEIYAPTLPVFKHYTSFSLHHASKKYENTFCEISMQKETMHGQKCETVTLLFIYSKALFE